MGLNYVNLDDQTRKFMVEEIDTDVANETIYLSSYLSDAGLADWATLLRTAAERHDDGWLAEQLRGTGRLKHVTERRKPKGGYTTVKVPVTAPETMAEGEFNRFYVRGLCRRAIEEGIDQVIVYRAKEVMNPRPDSQAKIGSEYDPTTLLADLRATIGVEPALGLPPGPNSGLTARLP